MTEVARATGIGIAGLAGCLLLFEVAGAVSALYRSGKLLVGLSGLLSALAGAAVLTSPVWLIVLVAAVAGGAFRSHPRRLARRRPRALPVESEAPAEPPRIEMLAPEKGEFTPGCPVCGVTLSGPIRRCPVCDSPHHPDCWDYHGSCATYGCEGV